MRAANAAFAAPIVIAPTSTTVPGQEHFAAPNSGLKLSIISEDQEKLDETAQTIE